MKYCLFCREAFEDETKACPYCGDALADELPTEEGERADDARADGAGGAGEPDDEYKGIDTGERLGERLVPVAIVKNEADLREVVAALSEYGTYFEIEEADVTKRLFGLVPGRTWRVMVRDEDGPETFLRLVKAVPQVYPAEVTERIAEEEEEVERHVANGRIVEIMESSEPEASGAELAGAIVEGFASDDAAGIARAKYALARHGRLVAGLLGDIAAASVAQGGEGAERVLFNALEVLEAVGDESTLARIEPHFASPQPRVRARAAYAAGRLGVPAAVDKLIHMLADEDEEVRFEASSAVWRLTGMDFDYDPYGPEDERARDARIMRDTWEKSDHRGRVRSRVDLSELLRAMGEAE